MGLQNGETVGGFAFAVPNRKTFIHFDIKIPQAERPEYRVLLYL